MMFNEIIKLQNGPVKYVKVNKGNIRMENHSFPYSIREEEYDFLYNIIVENNLQRGFELATAFGISGTAIGTAFKKTGGKFVTMDAYVEEKCDNPGKYKDFEKQVYEQSDGYKSVKFLIEHFELQNTMFAEIGWSPDDVGSAINKHFPEKLDFVFLDAGHFEHHMIRDIDAIRPHLADKFLFVFHDVYSNSCTENVHKHIEKCFGKRIEIILPYPKGENMGVVKCL
jgi:predicted O-methyltransferase YrrM